MCLKVKHPIRWLAAVALIIPIIVALARKLHTYISDALIRRIDK